MMLKKGMIGPEVAQLTADLVKIGYIVGTPGDNYNRFVEGAIKAFQSENIGPDLQPLVVDGEVGPLTRWAIDVALGKIPTPAVPPAAVQPPAAKPGGSSKAGWNALQVALKELKDGSGEEGGNNKGPDIRRYHAVTGASEGDSWCASFVSYCFHEGNPRAMPFNPSAGARDVLAQFKRKGWNYQASVANPPAPGDIVVWWRGSATGWMGHIGIVAEYKNGLVRTIEGNRGNYPSKVTSFTYVLGRIDKLLGFGRAVP